jgi:organic radical activating enzyme
LSDAFVSEIYASVQGEGPWTGERHIFLRLAGCPLRCDYCDTPGSLSAAGHPRRRAADVAADVTALARREAIDTVSVTGGEPLAQAAFLTELLPLLKTEGLRIYLETAGVLPDGLAAVIDHCDVVSMDIKLPSATGKSWWDAHARFLDISGTKAYAKLVVERHTPADEINRAIDLLAAARPVPVLVLQPVTARPPAVLAPSATVLQAAFQAAARRLPRVIVLEQQHKLWDLN